ncbi:MAG: hypothetical protein JXQ90_23070 [Cyclobacteriaceae bacterium]
MYSMEDLVIFFGRFHPLVVHLPIGFLMMAFFMWAYQQWQRSDQFSGAISFSLLLGTISGIFACALGWLLASPGGYEQEMLDDHKWAGIGTTIVAMTIYLLWILRRSVNAHYLVAGLFVCLMAGLSITGHVGGSLTHGSDYLLAYAPFREKPVIVPPPTSMEEVLLFDHVVKPMLDSKCSSCHRDGKKKGELSLQTKESLMAGGKSGPSIVEGHSLESELIKRVMLPEWHDDVMPPEGKSPLTDEEKTLLALWIDKGGDFEVRLVDIDIEEDKYKLIGQVVGLDGAMNAIKPMPPVSDDVLSELTDVGFVIRELVAGTHAYDVTFPKGKFTASYRAIHMMDDLRRISANTIWLNISGLGLTDDHINHITTFPVLRKLRIERNELSDAGVRMLEMPEIERINLYGNPVTNELHDYLGQLSNLKKVYGWQTAMMLKEDLGFELVL